MTVFHINPESGYLGRCKAKKGRCPYGGDSGSDNHFSSVEEATKAFEELMKDELVPVSLKKDDDAPKPRGDQTLGNKIREGYFPNIENSNVIAPAAISDNEGYMGGRRFKGGKCDSARKEHGGLLPTKEVTRKIRADVKKAEKEMEIPPDIKVGVRGSSGSWTGSITMTIGMKDGRQTAPIDDRYYNRNYNMYSPRDESVLTDEGKKLGTYLENLGNQWADYESNSQVDYFRSNNRVHVQWKTS